MNEPTTILQQCVTELGRREATLPPVQRPTYPGFLDEGSSEALDKLVAAIAKASASFDEIEKNRTAKVEFDKKNGQQGEYKYDYATLDEIMSTIRPSLAAQGCIVQFPTSNSGIPDGYVRQFVRVRGHGAMMTNWLDLPVEMWNEGKFVAASKEVAKSVTYWKRHLLNGMLGLTGGEAIKEDADADGAYEVTTHRKGRSQSPNIPVEPQATQRTVTRTEEPRVQSSAVQPLASVEQRKALMEAFREHGIGTPAATKMVFDLTGKSATKDLTVAEVDRVIAKLHGSPLHGGVE